MWILLGVLLIAALFIAVMLVNRTPDLPDDDPDVDVGMPRERLTNGMWIVMGVLALLVLVAVLTVLGQLTRSGLNVH